MYHNAQQDNLEENAAYLFVIGGFSQAPTIQGDMPRGKAVGYIFNNGSLFNDGRLVAHELGHGLFALEHTFATGYGVPQGSTNNLMDYVNNDFLASWQWKIINNPGFVWNFLEGDEDGMVVRSIDVLNSFVLLRQCYLYQLSITNITVSSRTLQKSTKFFEYTIKDYLTIKYNQSGNFSNISFTKNDALGTNGKNVYQIKLGDFGEINCLSEEDRNAIYDFLINKDKHNKVFGNKILTLSNKEYTLQSIYSDSEKLKVDILKSGETITETDKLILNVPLIQWQLGWYYAAAFYNNWLTSGGDIAEDEKLTTWLQSWNVYKTRISEFETEFNKHTNKSLTEKQTKNYYAINSIFDLGMTDPQTNIYIMSDLQNLVKDTVSIQTNYLLQWNADDRKYTNFAKTTIAANEDAKTFSAWLASFGSVSIQHCFGGIVTLNDSKRTVIDVSDMYIYIRDGFDFSGDNQPLGEWDNNIFSPKKPNIAALTWLNFEGSFNDLYLTNSKLNEFRNKFGIGKNFNIYLKPIKIENIFNKIIINKENNEITYQK
jgi:hypothetical protein